MPASEAETASRAFEHCEDLVRRQDKDRYLAALFAPKKARRFLFALYAFDLEVRAILEKVRQPLAGQIRLQWWREVIAGERAAEAAASPVANALVQSIATVPRASKVLIDYLEAHEFDVLDEHVPDLTVLEGYASRSDGSIVRLAAVLLGARESSALEAASAHAGAAICLTRLVRSGLPPGSPERRFLPSALAVQSGLPESGPSGQANSRSALEELRSSAYAHLRQAAEALRHVEPAALPAFLPLAVAPLYLAPAETEAGEGSAIPVLEVPQWRRQWRLWRAARNLPGTLGSAVTR